MNFCTITYLKFKFSEYYRGIERKNVFQVETSNHCNSVLFQVVHSVHGIMFKDLKQILRKEQCDMAILLTAHAPSAKKIIVHGPQGIIVFHFIIFHRKNYFSIILPILRFRTRRWWHSISVSCARGYSILPAVEGISGLFQYR